MKRIAGGRDRMLMAVVASFVSMGTGAFAADAIYAPKPRPDMELLLPQFVPSGRPTEKEVAISVELARVSKASVPDKNTVSTSFDVVFEPEPEPQVFNFASVQLSDADVTARKKEISSKILRGTATDDDILAFSEVLISKLLLEEARSFLAKVAGEDDVAARRDGLLGVISLLDGQQAEGNNLFTWEEGSLWEVLSRLAASESVDRTELRGAAAGLGQQALDVVNRATPMIFEGAIGLNDAALSRDILNAAVQTSDLAGTSELLYMQGRLAQLVGDDRMAFDFHLAASKEISSTGAKATLEIANIALKRADRGVLRKTQSVLEEALTSWSGDGAALELMAKLAEVSEETRDIPVALEVMSDLKRDYPDTPQAGLATVRIPVLLREYLRDIDAGAVTLDELLVAHRRLSPRMADVPEWFGISRAVAKELDKSGLKGSAVAEYRRLVKMVDHLGIQGSAADLTYLEFGELLVEAAMLDEAREVFQKIPHKEDHSFERRRIVVGAQSSSPDIMDEAHVVVSTFSGDGELMSILGKYALDMEELEFAITAYAEMEAAGNPLSEVDQARYGLALGQLSKGEGMKSPLGISNEKYAGIVDGTLKRRPKLSPLSAETADAVVAETDRILEITASINTKADAE